MFKFIKNLFNLKKRLDELEKTVKSQEQTISFLQGGYAVLMKDFMYLINSTEQHEQEEEYLEEEQMMEMPSIHKKDKQGGLN